MLSAQEGDDDGPPAGCPADAWETWRERCKLRQLEIKADEVIGDDGAVALAAVFASGACKTGGMHAPGQLIGPEGMSALAAAIGSGATKLGGLSASTQPIPAATQFQGMCLRDCL